MGVIFEKLIESFVRYVIPGFIFILVLFIPFSICNWENITDEIKNIDITLIAMVAVAIGYLLDSLGAYRWTFQYREYKRLKIKLTNNLSKISDEYDGYDDPDLHIAILWRKDESLYNRIFVERAEWVLILESSFSLITGSIVCFFMAFAYLIQSSIFCIIEVLIGFLLLIMADKTSKKGIQRMEAHNKKLIEALKYIEDRNEALK